MPELGLATHLRPCGDTHLWQTGNMALMLAAGCQVSKRGPRGKIEINGNGHAGGAISRIGSGRITVTPGSCLILTSGNSTRNHQDDLQDACQNQQNFHKWSVKISLGRFSSASSRSWPGWPKVANRSKRSFSRRGCRNDRRSSPLAVGCEMQGSGTANSPEVML